MNMYVKKKTKTRNNKKTKNKKCKKPNSIQTRKSKRGRGRDSKTLNKINKDTYGIVTNFLRPNNLSKLTQTSKEMKRKTNNLLKKQGPLVEAKNKLSSILFVPDMRTIIKKEDFDHVNLSEHSVLLDVIEYPLYDMVKCIWNEDGHPYNSESNENENENGNRNRNRNNRHNNGIRSKDYYFCVDQLFNFQGDENGEEMDRLISLDEESINEIEDIYLMKHFYSKQYPKYSKIKYVIKIMNGESNRNKLEKLKNKIKVFQSSATLKNYKEKYNEILDDIFEIGSSVFIETKNKNGFEMLATFSIFGDSIIEQEFELKM